LICTEIGFGILFVAWFAVQECKKQPMIKNYFITAWRNLVKNRVYSTINIAGLSIGMAVALLIALWMYDELSFDRNFQHYDRIAKVIQNVTNNGEVQTWNSVPYPLAEELRKNYGSDFKRVVMSAEMGDHLLTFNDKKLKETGGFFEAGAAEMFSFTMLLGDWKSLDEPASVLLSQSSARALFGNEDPANRMIKIDQLPVVKVTGVYQDFPRNSTFADLNFVSNWTFIYQNDAGLRTMEDPWRPNFTTLYVQLNEQTDINKASVRIRDAKLKRVNAQLAKKKPALFLQPMSQWHLYSEYKNGVNTGGAIQYVWIFGIIGVFVLLLACINFMNLSTARSEKRAKEVGIRKTVGSATSQLIFQFFNESLLTTLFSFAMCLLLVQLTLPFFNLVADKQMAVLWGNPVFWLAGLGFTLIAALIAGSYPAFYLSSFKPVKVLKGTFKAGRYAALPRRILVVLQFTVSVTLIIGTIIVYRQIQFAKNRPVGYAREGLISIPQMNASIHSHFSAVQEELKQTGAVVSMAESGSSPTGINNSTSGLSWRGKDPSLSVDFSAIDVSYDYGKTIDWQIQQGRDFSKDYPSDSTAMILNQAAAHYMELKNPIGEIVTWWGKPYTVIGVVDDLIMQSPYDEPRPTVFNLLNDAENVIIVRINPKVSAKVALDQIGPIFKKYNTEQPFEFHFVDDDYAQKFSNEERVGKLASCFALLAVIISCLGLFGLTSYVAEQRTKEIGIRKVLGASILNVWQLLSMDFVFLVLLSFIVAMPLAYYFMYNWLQNYEYRTTLSWWLFAAPALGSVAITILVVSFQTIRAAFARPVLSLRME
jgi:ABC-type antimicrobial peptide transport system permease subunit